MNIITYCFKISCRVHTLYMYILHVSVCIHTYTLSTRVSADGQLNFRSMLMRILFPPTRAWDVAAAGVATTFGGCNLMGFFPRFYEPPHHGSPEEAAATEASWSHGPQPEKLAMHLFVYFTSLIPLQAESGGG